MVEFFKMDCGDLTDDEIFDCIEIAKKEVVKKYNALSKSIFEANSPLLKEHLVAIASYSYKKAYYAAFSLAMKQYQSLKQAKKH